MGAGQYFIREEDVADLRVMDVEWE